MTNVIRKIEISFKQSQYDELKSKAKKESKTIEQYIHDLCNNNKADKKPATPSASGFKSFKKEVDEDVSTLRERITADRRRMTKIEKELDKIKADLKKIKPATPAAPAAPASRN